MPNVLRVLSIRVPARALAAILALLAAGAGSPAEAKIAYGITTGHIVYTFDTSVPNVEISHRAINLTKLQPGESELAIDLRPATGQVYMLGSTSRLYVLDPADGNVVPIAAAPFTPALSGTAFAMEFDPVTDTIRVISNTVATRITSDVGIVVERAMYWPFDPSRWQEAHNAFGVTSTSRRWGLAEGRVGGSAGFQTFVLLANPDVAAATVTATFLRTTGAPVVKTFVVQPDARLTVTTGPGSMVPELANESFGVSLVADRPIFVEHAVYSNANGVVFAAGGAATASELP